MWVVGCTWWDDPQFVGCLGRYTWCWGLFYYWGFAFISFQFWGHLIFISFSLKFHFHFHSIILYLSVKLDVQGAFSMTGFSVRTEWGWLGVVNYCKVNDHRLSSFSSCEAWFRKYGHFKLLGCPGWDKGSEYNSAEVLHPTRGSSVHGCAHLLD